MSPSTDGTEERITRAVHDNSLIALVIFLELKCDGNGVGKGQEGVI
jgi:hypothetical protein